MVIPKAIRDLLGLRPGDEVEVILDVASKAARIAPVRDEASLRGRFAGLRLTSDLVVEHQAERRRDRLP